MASVDDSAPDAPLGCSSPGGRLDGRATVRGPGTGLGPGLWSGLLDGLTSWWQLSGSMPIALVALFGLSALGPGPVLGVVRTERVVGTLGDDPGLAAERPVLPGLPGYPSATTPVGAAVDAVRLLSAVLAHAVLAHAVLRPAGTPREGDRRGLS